MEFKHLGKLSDIRVNDLDSENGEDINCENEVNVVFKMFWTPQNLKKRTSRTENTLFPSHERKERTFLSAVCVGGVCGLKSVYVNRHTSETGTAQGS